MVINLVEHCSHSIKHLFFREGFRQYKVDERAYIVRDVFLGIVGHKDYRELGIDSERTPDEVGTG